MTEDQWITLMKVLASIEYTLIAILENDNYRTNLIKQQEQSMIAAMVANDFNGGNDDH